MASDLKNQISDNDGVLLPQLGHYDIHWQNRFRLT